MKRSEINQIVKNATSFFKKHDWVLPPNPKWDVTDFGLDDFKECGLVLINLAEEKEYCEKLMYALKNQKTPAHCHASKKEDIIVRFGEMKIKLWMGKPNEYKGEFTIKINGENRQVISGDTIVLHAGERITITPGIYHEFYPTTEECIIGEVSTANNDVSDNFFVNSQIGRYAEIIEDEPPLVKLLSDN